MSDIKQRITDLANLMGEFNLSEAELNGDSWKIAFRRTPTIPAAAHDLGAANLQVAITEHAPELTKPKGTPVTSPMNGVFYSAPNPGAPPFVREGDAVSAGQVVGLIEAMKVFNELTAPISGTVGEIAAESGSLVQPGQALLYIE